MIRKINAAVVLIGIIHIVQAVLRIFVAQKKVMRVIDLPRKIIVDVRGLDVINPLRGIGSQIIVSDIVVVLENLKGIGYTIIEPIRPIQAEFTLIPPSQALRKPKKIGVGIAPRIV